MGSLITGATVSLFGVRTALCINGAVAVVAHLAIARTWSGAPLLKSVE
ncbi:MAG: hypothetical protein WDO56_07795 [Gammaproteobacteria bacterium]